MSNRDYRKLITGVYDRGEKRTAIAERNLAKIYRAAYEDLTNSLASLYKKMGDNPSMQEARRYARLDSLRKDVNAAYKSLLKKNISETTANNSFSYANSVYGTEWAIDQATGIELKWDIIPVDAIRSSVFSDVAGKTFVDRFKGEWTIKNIIKVDNAIGIGLTLGESYPKVARRIKENIQSSYNEAIRIVRTEATRSQTLGHLQTYDMAQEMGIKMQKKWVATLDERTRSSHGHLDGQNADDEGLFWIGNDSAEGPGLFSLPENSINCIPEDAIPIGIDIEKLYKRPYAGDLIVIKTANGNEIRVTPNHPILTDNGWVKAGKIDKGCNIVSVRFRKLRNIFNPNIQDSPPIAAKIFDLASVIGSLERMPGIDHQFHGDGRDSNVDIITLDSKLGYSFNASIYKPLIKFKFSISNILASSLSYNSSLGKFINRSFHSFNSLMRGIRKIKSFLWRTIGHSLIHSIGSIANRNAGIFKDFSNWVARDIQFYCNGLFRHSPKVFSDNVISIERVPYLGHVYNLQTKQGWYGLYHNNGSMSIVHNCRCRVIEIIEGLEPELRRIRDEGLVPYVSYDEWAESKGYKDGKWPVQSKL